jgi:glycosyltransferase involved in cell wall biosynthesis
MPCPARLLPELAAISRDRRKRLAEIVAAGGYHRIHVFRLYAAPLALPEGTVPGTPPVQLDLDDLDLDFRLQLAAHHRQGGRRRMAAQCALAAERYRTLEREIIPRCDRVFVASSPDRATLLKRFSGVDVAVLPNVVEPCPVPRNKREGGGKPTLLFLGTLGYLPNADGLVHFLDGAWPLIKASFPDCRLFVAGRGLPRALARRLADDPSIDCRGEVDSVDAVYAAADAAIVPLRLGAGTRIKILEAFALGCPVVSTTVGAHGLEVTDGEHLLLGDSPERFAAACRRLLTSPDLALRLADNAAAFVRDHHSPANLSRILG